MDCINIRNLVKSFNNKGALKGIELSVPTGSIYGFLGPNGAGKTTTIKILIGLITKDEGKVSILGHALEDISIDVRCFSIFHDRHLCPGTYA